VISCRATGSLWEIPEIRAEKEKFLIMNGAFCRTKDSGEKVRRFRIMRSSAGTERKRRSVLREFLIQAGFQIMGGVSVVKTAGLILHPIVSEDFGWGLLSESFRRDGDRNRRSQYERESLPVGLSLG